MPSNPSQHEDHAVFNVDKMEKLDASGASSPISDSGNIQRESSMTQDPPVERTRRKSSAAMRPECFKSTAQEIIFVLVATLATAMSSYLQGAVTVMSTFIARDINMSNAEIIWLTAASGLSAGSFLLVFGRLADLVGRRSMFLTSLSCFTILALGAGFSRNGFTLDILSGFMGLTNASAVPAALGILGTAYGRPSKRKNYAFACYAAGNPVGFVFGCIFSGIATDLANWRAGYWVMAVIYFFSTVLAFFTVPKDASEKLRFSKQTLKRFDLIGALFIVSGVALFSAALSLGSVAPYGWRTDYVIITLILGVLLIAGFFSWENYYTEPLVPMRIWRDRNFSLLIVIIMCGFMGFGVASFWISLYMQRVLKYSSLEVAVHLLPMAIGGTLVNVFAGLVLHKISNKWLMLVGTVAYPAAFLILAVQKYGFTYWVFLFIPQLLEVVGADLQFNVANMYIMSSLEAERQSVAGSILQMVTRLVTTVGFGAASAIYDAVEQKPMTSGYYANDPVQPYAATWWFCFGISACAVIAVPFLKIGTQGHAPSDEVNNDHETSDINEELEKC